MTAASVSDAFLRALPKAELHLHIEGSLEPELMFALSERNGIALPFKSVEDVREAYRFNRLQDFLDIYYQGARVLIQARDFHDLGVAYFERLHQDGGTHAELFFDPQTHTQRGVAFATVAEGLLSACAEAEARFAITSKLIICFLRHLPEDSAFQTLTEAEPYLDRIAAVGLDSSELGHPPSKFERVFARARELGLLTVAHAGEEGPPAYVWEALDALQVSRIDHGNRALEDDALVARLVAERMTLTVCPLSNLKLCVVDDLQRHPLKRMLDLGLQATVNSDDPAYFGGYLLANYRETADALALTREEVAELARNSFRGAFIGEAAKAAAIAEIDRVLAS